MPHVRPMREDDVPGAVELFARVYPQHRWRSRAACEAYFHDILFAGPWRDCALPSWVAEDGRRIAGLYAVLPRRMRFGGRTLRVAVGCQFMVEAGPRRSLLALQLAQACLGGPQDLTLADGANDATRRMWRAVGGEVPLLYALHWTRPLRPAGHALALLERRGAPLVRAARPLAALADALAARLRPNRLLHAVPDVQDAPLDAAQMLAALPEAMQGTALQPQYDPRTLGWLLDQARGKTRHGALRARLVGARGRALGWFLYYARRGAPAEVLQLASAPGGFDRVLCALLADAWRQGATAVHGRVDPRYAQELSRRHCWFRWDGTWTLAHTRDPALAAALHAGEAFLSRMEGEWWMRFLDEDAAPALEPDRRRARDPRAGPSLPPPPAGGLARAATQPLMVRRD